MSTIGYPEGSYLDPGYRESCYKAAYAALNRAKSLGARPGWMYSKQARDEVGLSTDEARLVLDWAEDQIGL